MSPLVDLSMNIKAMAFSPHITKTRFIFIARAVMKFKITKQGTRNTLKSGAFLPS